MSKDQYNKTYNYVFKSDAPPPGTYHSRFASVERSVIVPKYGEEKQWGRPNEKQAKQLMESNFWRPKEPSHPVVCSRIDRSLHRDRVG